ncbi:MAG: hypothetical protein L6R37_003737 [Teloschistes peruensis]|nr:MAG: hypothetical protein L6R37_003737 [Teloschistes peruensis]
MGGYHLQAPGYPAFPLNARQLFFLISNGHVDFPAEDETDIDDKNKRDGLARLLTVAQILIFLIKSVVRASQHLAITSLELTTLAFIFAMILASWFWKDKPQDVNKPFVLKSKASISEILTSAGVIFNEEYIYTPLDFLSNEEWFINMAWTRGRKFLRQATLNLLWKEKDPSRPVKKIRSDIVPSLSLPLMIICECLVIAYSAIFLAGWNIAFPTPVEGLLWRITTSIMLGFGFLGGWLFFFVDVGVVRKQQRNAASNSALRTMGQGAVGWLVPRNVLSQVNERGPGGAGWEDVYFERIPKVPRPLLVVAATMSVVYFWTRLFVLLEDFVSLRSLPDSAYTTVAWTRNLPHS